MYIAVNEIKSEMLVRRCLSVLEELKSRFQDRVSSKQKQCADAFTQVDKAWLKTADAVALVDSQVCESHEGIISGWKKR